MGRMTRQHPIEVGLALALTVVAFLFVALTVWADQRTGIVVSDAWVRPTIGEGRVTAAYMKIQNVGTAEDVLRGVQSPKAARVEIHETNMTADGVMKMRVLENGLALPAGGSASLKPGGAHIMILGLDGKLAKGQTLPLTLEFETAGRIEISVPVGTEPPSAAGKEGAAAPDHQHH